MAPKRVAKLISCGRLAVLCGSRDLATHLKTMGIGNIISPKPKFNKEVLIKMRNIFKALLNNERFMPLEFEITTISSWK